MDLQVVERVARILEVVGDADGIGVTDVAARTGLPLPTASRLLANLRDLGRLERDGRHYRLTRPGRRLAADLGVDVAARAAAVVAPPVAAAQAALGETVALWRLDPRARAVTCVGCHVPDEPLRVGFAAGTSLPLHAGAVGVAVLAQGGDLLRDDVLRSHLDPTAKRTITHPDALLSELHSVKRRGWASSVHAEADGVWTLAVAGTWGTSVVAAALHGPTSRQRRVGQPEVERLRGLLVDVAVDVAG